MEKYLPSWLRPTWPRMMRSVLPLCQSQTRIVLSSEADTSCVPSGVKAMPLISAMCAPLSSCRIGYVVVVDHLGGHLLRRPRGQGRRDTPLSPGAQDLQAQLGARLLAGEIGVNVGAVVDHRAVDREDDVAVARCRPVRQAIRGAGALVTLAPRGDIPAELVRLRPCVTSCGFRRRASLCCPGRRTGPANSRTNVATSRRMAPCIRSTPNSNLATLLQVSPANETAGHLPADITPIAIA